MGLFAALKHRKHCCVSVVRAQWLAGSCTTVTDVEIFRLNGVSGTAQGGPDCHEYRSATPQEGRVSIFCLVRCRPTFATIRTPLSGA